MIGLIILSGLLLSAVLLVALIQMKRRGRLVPSTTNEKDKNSSVTIDVSDYKIYRLCQDPFKQLSIDFET